MVKYTLARVGIFIVIAVVLMPLVHDLLLAMLISAVVTSVVALFVLKRWRDEVASTLENSMTARRAEKEKLRSALAGDDQVGLEVKNGRKRLGVEDRQA
jgi:mannitol-specific phosphotransferase system IIBC component